MLAIVSAMQEEIEALLGALADIVVTEHWPAALLPRHTARHERSGRKAGRWGKVAAAATVTEHISTFKTTDIVLSGVAGAVDPCLRSVTSSSAPV